MRTGRIVWKCGVAHARKCISQHYTQGHLADAIGVSARTIANIEAGYDASAKTMHRIARFFDTTIENLWCPLEESLPPLKTKNDGALEQLAMQHGMSGVRARKPMPGADI